MSSTSSGPTVLDYDVADDRDRVIIGAERSDVSVVVESPRDLDADELRAILEEIPGSVAVVDELLKGGSE